MMFQIICSVICGILMFNQAPETPATDTATFTVEKWHYDTKGRRDPFVPLIGVGESGTLGHLTVESLHLIGILWGEKGYYGIVKDGVNNGYILKVGDKVSGGKVTEINSQSVIFEIMHAGVVTKYELRLKGQERR